MRKIRDTEKARPGNTALGTCRAEKATWKRTERPLAEKASLDILTGRAVWGTRKKETRVHVPRKHSLEMVL